MGAGALAHAGPISGRPVQSLGPSVAAEDAGVASLQYGSQCVPLALVYSFQRVLEVVGSPHRPRAPTTLPGVLPTARCQQPEV